MTSLLTLAHADWLRVCLIRGGAGWQRLRRRWRTDRAEAELRALDARELLDLGLDRGGIAFAARRGREFR